MRKILIIKFIVTACLILALTSGCAARISPSEIDFAHGQFDEYLSDYQRYIVKNQNYVIADIADDTEISGFKWYYKIESADSILAEDIKTGTAPEIVSVGDGIVRLTLGYGSNAITVQYFDLYKNRKSSVYELTTAYADYFDEDTALIAYLVSDSEMNGKNPNMIICEIFDDSVSFGIERKFLSLFTGLNRIVFLNEDEIYIDYDTVAGATNEEYIYENKGEIEKRCEVVDFRKDGRQPDITIETNDLSIKSIDGLVISSVYYEKPIISGESAVAHNINSYFQNKEQDWIDGYSLKSFNENAVSMRETLGDAALIRQPLIFSIDSDIAYINNDIVSIFQVSTWYSGGPSSRYYFGSTFSLETGEKLNLDYFIDLDISQFRNAVVDFLIGIANRYYPEKSNTEIAEYYKNYEYEDFEFYWNGEAFFLLLNDGYINGEGSIMEWNGKIGDEFYAELYGYTGLRTDEWIKANY